MKYDRDKLSIKKEKEYNPKRKVEKDSLIRKEKEFHKVETHDKSTLSYPQKVFDKKMIDKKVFDKTQTIEWDLFQWADYEFVQWANQQPATMVIAIMAEMKKSPKMKPSIEILRPRVASIPLCSIEIYRKKKRLGERSVEFLKQMKKRYGNSLLRILYATSENI
jgi:hypothetical protein